jgi:3-deoxy-7-phosphoheptulonate synthase
MEMNAARSMNSLEELVLMPGTGAVLLLESGISAAHIEHNLQMLTGAGRRSKLVRTESMEIIVVLEDSGASPVFLGELRGVLDCRPVSGETKLVRSGWKADLTGFDVDGERIGTDTLCLAFGPCSVHSEKQLETVARFLSSRGIRFMRGGAYKPRTTPYQFTGMGLEGLKLFRSVADQYGLRVVSEITEVSQIDGAAEYLDVVQIGTRNSQNVALLNAVGQLRKPVLLKRGFGNTVSEFLGAAEYIYAAGNEKIILCERGIKTFESAYRNTTDINAVAYLKQASHLPVFLDPSHSVGTSSSVEAVALAALAAGADGLLVETTDVPSESKTDALQALSLEQADKLITRSRKVYELVRDNKF